MSSPFEEGQLVCYTSCKIPQQLPNYAVRMHSNDTTCLFYCRSSVAVVHPRRQQRCVHVRSRLPM
jgi:hypothetical protein